MIVPGLLRIRKDFPLGPARTSFPNFITADDCAEYSSSLLDTVWLKSPFNMNIRRYTPILLGQLTKARTLRRATEISSRQARRHFLASSRLLCSKLTV